MLFGKFDLFYSIGYVIFFFYLQIGKQRNASTIKKEQFLNLVNNVITNPSNFMFCSLDLAQDEAQH